MKGQNKLEEKYFKKKLKRKKTQLLKKLVH